MDEGRGRRRRSRLRGPKGDGRTLRGKAAVFLDAKPSARWRSAAKTQAFHGDLLRESPAAALTAAVPLCRRTGSRKRMSAHSMVAARAVEATSAGAPRPGRYVTLDTLHGVAAIAVVVFHALERRGGNPGYLRRRPVLRAQRLRSSRRATRNDLLSGVSGRAGFLRTRLIRLYPLYLVGLCLSLVMPAISIIDHRGIAPAETSAVRAFPFALLEMATQPLVNGLSQQSFFPLNGPGVSRCFSRCWSMSCSAQMAAPLDDPHHLQSACSGLQGAPCCSAKRAGAGTGARSSAG